MVLLIAHFVSLVITTRVVLCFPRAGIVTTVHQVAGLCKWIVVARHESVALVLARLILQPRVLAAAGKGSRHYDKKRLNSPIRLALQVFAVSRAVLETVNGTTRRAFLNAMR